MEPLESTRLRTKRAQIAIALAGFAAISLFVGWSLPGGVAADRPVDVAMRQADAGAPGAAVPAEPEPATGKPRSRASCAGCGVVESMRRIDTPVVLMEGCDAGEIGGPRLGDHVLAGDGKEEVASLADTVASVVAGRRGVKKKIAVTTRHQIVVRLRDGTRQVFDEATPRTLQVGDRVKVIAGTPGANG